MDAAVPADERSTGVSKSGWQAVGPATGNAGVVQDGWEKGRGQDLAGATGLEGLHRQNHGCELHHTVPYYSLTTSRVERLATQSHTTD